MMRNLLPFYRFTLFLGLLLLVAGCFRVASNATPTPPVGEQTPVDDGQPATLAPQPPAPNPDAPTSSLPPATPAPQPPVPSSQLPVTSDPSSLPVIPLATRWRYDAAQAVTNFDLYSLDGGPLPDLLVGSADGRLLTLGLQQNEYWRVDLPAPISAVIGTDLDGDAIGDVLVGSEDGRIILFEGGQTRWEYPTPGMVTAVLLQETSGTIIVATGPGNLLALNRDGQEQWRFTLGEAPITTLAQADVNADGRVDIIAATTTGQVTAVSADGAVQWQAEAGGAIRSLAAVDLNGDGAAEVVVGTAAGNVVALTSTGSLLWQQRLNGPVTTLAVANLDGDGVPDLLAGDSAGIVTALAADGRSLWRSRFFESSIAALVAGDIDGDGRVEVILGGVDGHLMVLDDGGAFRGGFTARAPVTGLRLADMDQGEASPRPELIAKAGSSLYLLDTLGSATASADPALARPATVAIPPASLVDSEQVTLLALGDVALSSQLADGRFLYGADYLLAGLRPLLDAADFTIFNLESALTLRGEPATKRDLRRADQTLLELLAGVDVALLANDHILDYGLTGLNDTLDALIERGIPFTGVGVNLAAATTPVVLTAQGQQVAFLAFTDAAPTEWVATAEGYGVAPADAATIATAVTQASAQAEVVVVALHTAGGQQRVSQAQAALAATAVDAGADLVLGYGTDEVLRTERYNGGLIAYGLGGTLTGEAAILRSGIEDGQLVTPELLLTAVTAKRQPQLRQAEDGGVARITDFPEAVVEPDGGLALVAGDLPFYDLVVDLDYERHTAVISQTVIFANDSSDEWADVVFHAAPAYWGTMLNLREVTVILGGESFVIPPTRNTTMLRIPLPRLVGPGETVAVTFDYSLALPRLDPVGWGPEGNAGWGPNLIQMGDWYPALIPYVSGEGWQTWQYWPVGDPVISRLADFDVRITTAPDVVIAAPGFVGGEDGARRYQLSQARAFAFLASPNYVRFDGRAEGIPVQVYVTGGYQNVGPVLVQTVEQALTLFSDIYGPYPYDEFVLAENGFLTAMEYSAIVSLSGFAFDAYEGTAESLLVAITAHEVAHQWWYGSVGNDQVTEPWLDESLAMMSELLFYERYYPALVDWWWWYRVDRWEPAGAVDVTIYDYSTSEAFVHNMYGRAVYFLFDLRERMGEAAFRSFLRTYYQQNGLQFVTREDFFAAVRASTAVDISDLIALYFNE